MQLLGLAARAGAVVAGTQPVREKVRTGAVRFALVATDLTPTGRDKLLPLLEGRNVPFVVRYERVELGRAVGKSPLATVGVVDSGFAERLVALLDDE
ncbi:MAG: L7Ae/L30e/S12e/Gadd45 family ribosomal protein [Gemmatimonadota bacterium]